MRRLTLLLALTLATPLAAQRGGSGAPPMQTRDPTPLDLFQDKLRLDEKQTQAVTKIFTAAGVEAKPISDEMIKLRMRLLELELAGKQDEMKPVLNTYTGAAARMTSVEVRAMDAVKAVLKGGQLSKVSEAFALIGGVFNPASPKPPAAPRGGGVQ